MECTVCFESKEAAAFISSPLTSACVHKPATCLDCLQAAIRADLSSKPWSEVGCPECGGVLAYDVVQRYADAATRQKHHELAIRHALQDDEDFIWVISPPRTHPPMHSKVSNTDLMLNRRSVRRAAAAVSCTTVDLISPSPSACRAAA